MTTTPSPVNPRVVVVVLCWNGNRWIEACLQSVMASHHANADLHVMVVDNASTDGSQKKIIRQFPDVQLIANKRNLGFAEGNNVGIRSALAQGADYILLLNQDTVVAPNWLVSLVDVAQRYPDVGILSPMQYDYEMQDLDRVFKAQFVGNTSFEKDCLQETVADHYEVPGVIGAAMMLRRKMVDQLGMFDPYYFAYFEEKDLCRRAASSGYRIAVVPQSRIGHWHGKEHPDQVRTDLEGLFLRNRQIFIIKDPDQSVFRNLYIYFRYGLPGSLLRRYDSPRQPPSFFKALKTQLDILWHLPRILRTRHRELRQIRSCRKTNFRAQSHPL